MTTVKAIRCPKCKDVIFSRACHDFHSCSCGTISIDGGFDYIRILCPPDMDTPKIFSLEIEQTRHELYEDWNCNENKYGIISGEK